MGKVVAVFPVDLLHHIVSAVVVRQMDKPIGHRVAAGRTNEEDGHVLGTAFLLDPLGQIALDQVLPAPWLMRLQLFKHVPWHMLIQADICNGFPVRLAVG